MGVLRSFAKDIELSGEWLHNPDLDQRPFGSFNWMVAMSVIYLVLISILSYLMKDRRNKPERPFNVFWISVLVNLFMCVYSAYTMIGTSAVLLENWYHLGFDPLIPLCDPSRLLVEGYDYWFYTFYLSKFVEWFDSILLILRAKPLMPPGNSQYFLHVFHHAVTASIVWVAWRTNLSGAWVGPWTNSIVHTFMYGYYLLTDLGMDRKWGGIFITPIQLVQFVFCIAVTAYEFVYWEKCGTNFYSVCWMWFTYFIFLAFFVKLFLDKKKLREQARRTKATKSN